MEIEIMFHEVISKYAEAIWLTLIRVRLLFSFSLIFLIKSTVGSWFTYCLSYSSLFGDCIVFVCLPRPLKSLPLCLSALQKGALLLWGKGGYLSSNPVTSRPTWATLRCFLGASRKHGIEPALRSKRSMRKSSWHPASEQWAMGREADHFLEDWVHY